MAGKKKKYLWEKSYPLGVAWDNDIPLLPLYSLIQEAAQAFPTKTCLNYYGKKYTYLEIDQLSDKMAYSLQSIGIRKGDRVGLFMPNCPQFLIAYFAILKLGAVCVCFNPLYTVHELKSLVQDSAVKLLFTLNLKILHEKTDNLLQTTQVERVVVSRMENFLPLLKSKMFSWLKKDEIASFQFGRVNMDFSQMLENSGKYKEVEINPEQDMAIIQYTGGTSGVVKGAMLTHANLYANVMQCSLWFLDLERGKEKIIAALPFFHSFAMTGILNLGIHIGAELIVHARFELEKILKDISSKKASVMVGVPTIYTAINHYHRVHKYNFSSLKISISGGAPLPAEVKEKYAAITGCPLVEGYGLTECSPVVTVNPTLGKNKAGSVGLPLPGTIVEIRGVEGRRKILPEKEIGEICVKGPQVMVGYLHNDKETKDVIKQGRLHTGDLGYMDKEGYLFIVDRLKEVIISGGYNIYPREIEEELYQHSKIAEAAVIGIVDEYKGQKIKAYIKLKTGEELTQEEIQKYLQGRLAKYKIPASVEFKEDLPKTMIGKIDKKALV